MIFQSVAELTERLRSPALTGRDLYAAWEQRQPVPEPARGRAPLTATRQIPWLQDHLDLAVEFAARALEKEEFLLVCDCAREALRLWAAPVTPPDTAKLVRLRMHYAAALARLDDTPAARRQLEPCVAESSPFPAPLEPALRADILVQLGNILREQSVCAPLRAARDQIAGQALAFYGRALATEPGRLDALTLAAAAGFVISRPGSATREAAREHAREVLVRAAGPRYDLTYFRAVALAVLERPDEAASAFAELAGLPGATTPRLADARYWARTLAETLDLVPQFFHPAFPPLQLVVFSGHLPDRPDQPHLPPRFPTASVPGVRRRLDDALAGARATVGLAGGAAGADLLFGEAMRARGGAVHLVLPWSEAEFRRTSVIPFESADGPPLWQPKFDEALERATTVRAIGEVYQPMDPLGLAYTMEVAAGLALHAARSLRLDLLPMALWDGLPGRGFGGTQTFVELWRRLGREPIIVEPPRPATLEITAGHAGDVPTRASARFPNPGNNSTRCERDTLRQDVKTLLFADIVGYSKLRETVIPQFVGIFLEAVSRLTATSAHAPRQLNTWGDAIYAGFDFAHDAGCFAMELIQLIRDSQDDWARQGLYLTETLPGGEVETHPLDIRIGLHTGPVFVHYNPVLRQLNFTGTHVNRAARIEPVAAPGEVFASEEFTALAELDRVLRPEHWARSGGAAEALSFVCEYAGTMPLAKGYPGRHRIYRVAPHRVFALEELARVIHEDYRAAETRKGTADGDGNPATQPWETLPETWRDSNRAQAADLPNKLGALGYELAPSFGLPPSALVISDAQATELAGTEHDRWTQERRRDGWSHGPARDNERKLHPSMVPWEALSEEEKEKDRAAVRNVPKLIEAAGFRIRKIGRVG